MNTFQYKNNALYAEEVPLQVIAEKVGTPCYIYSRKMLESNWKAFLTPLKNQAHQINYAVKANSNIAILNLLSTLGAGFDIVSVGELERVLKAGGNPKKIVFSGVGKTKPELQRALEVKVGCINIESEDELLTLNEIATVLKTKVAFALRINPDVDAKSHPYISTGLKENKFGIDLSLAKKLYLKAKTLSHLQIHGIGCHIGSQIITLSPFLDALEKLLAFMDDLATHGIFFQHINMGGGLGVRYQAENPPTPSEYIHALLKHIQNRNISLYLEPGRAIVANAGLLLTRILNLKSHPHKNFAIVDAGMNDLLRPALYEAWQEIIPVMPHPKENAKYYDIVGPVCETADFLGKNRLLNIEQQDLLAILNSGAYGFSMSSNYNSRPRAAEVMVDGKNFHIIRARESLTDLFSLEKILPKEHNGA